MFERVAKLFLKVPAGLSLLCACLVLAVVTFSASSADAGIASGKVTTTHWKKGSVQGYALNAEVTLPATASLATVTVSGTGIAATDLYLAYSDSSVTKYVGSATLASRPTSPYATYTLKVVADDGSFATETLSAAVTGVNDSFPTPTAPVGGIAATAAPTFTWSAPSTQPAGGYVLAVNFADLDPWILTLGGTTTSAQYSNPDTENGYPAALNPYEHYEWSVAAVDASGNRAETRTSFMLGANFGGKVTDLSGAAIAGATIGVTGGDTIATTLSDGSYLFGGLAPGQYTVEFRSDTGDLLYYKNKHFPPGDAITVTSGQVLGNIDAVFGSWGVVIGSVSISGTTRPAGGVQVGLYTTAKVVVSSVPAVTIMADGSSYGTFELPLVPPGSYYVKFSAQGFVDVWKLVTVTADLTTSTFATLTTGTPTVDVFTAPATSATLLVSGISVHAYESAAGIAGYLITESPSAPASGAGWVASAPTTYTATSGGTKTLYAWAKGNSGIISASRTATVIVGPVIALSTLADQSVTSKQVVNVSGSASSSGSTISSVTVNGTAVTVNSDGSFSYPVLLATGSNAIAVAATNAAGATTTVTRTITGATGLPSLTVAAPADNAAVTASAITVAGTAATGSTIQVILNGGTPKAVTLSGTSYTTSLTLASGINTIEVVATDSGSKTNRIKRTVTLVSSGPSLQVTSPAEDMSITSVNAVTTTIAGTTSGSAVTVAGKSVTPDSSGNFSASVTLPVGTTGVVVTATDSSGNPTSVRRTIIISGKAGDCDGSGAVGAVEVQGAINMYLQINPVSGCVDTNSDGKVDAVEVQAVINAYLGL